MCPGPWKHQGFDVLFPFIIRSAFKIALQDGKMISSPVLERTEGTHCSNPQIFNTSNLLSANLSTRYLSSPRFPKHFICSRVTCPTTMRFQITQPAPQAGALGSGRWATNYYSSQQINPVPGHSMGFKVHFRANSVPGFSPSENSIMWISKKAHYSKAMSIQSH